MIDYIRVQRYAVGLRATCWQPAVCCSNSKRKRSETRHTDHVLVNNAPIALPQVTSAVSLGPRQEICRNLQMLTMMSTHVYGV